MKRIASLDALRGVAAFSVVISHLLLVLSVAHAPFPASWRAFLARWAVLTFFALSGFVLSLPYFDGRAQSYRVFVVRRFCRIYLPYAAVVAVAIALFYYVAGGSTHHDFLEDVNRSTVVQSLLMSGTMPSVSADPVTWSLEIEMRFALLFPLLVWLVRRDWKVTAFASALVSIVALVIVQRLHLDWYGFTVPVVGTTFGASLLVTAYYGSLFTGGIVLAMFGEELAEFARRNLLSLWAVTLALLAAGTLYDPCMLAAAVLLVALVPHTPAVVRAFEWPPIEWVGRISYSLYLVHIVVLMVVWRLTGSPLVAALVFVPLSLAIADLTYRYVEVPSIALGRRLTARRIAPVPSPATVPSP
ncbi:MAG: acyltransferase family protein [Vulcanimicrobiaceae bacterium]